MFPPFNWGHMARQAIRSIWAPGSTPRRLGAHRLKVLTMFWIIFIPHQFTTRLCLLLDEVFFPGWRKISLTKPLFITGLFRSGTTYLHRLMAGDSRQFSALKTWEIYLAPSIIQRRLLKLWKKLDGLVGSPAMNWLRHYNARNLGDIQFHQVGLWKEEEDEGLLLFLWDSLFTWFFFPDSAGIADYIFADREMSPRRQKRKLAFYRDCIQRHMYCHPDASVYLSKNPAFTPKLAALREAFPDARIVYLVRDPERVLVSQAAWFSFVWHYFASPAEAYPFRDLLMEMTRHWYSYPLKTLKKWESCNFLIIEYRKLIAEPLETITELYSHFNLQMDETYFQWLKEESRKTDEYASGQKIRIEDVGYNRESIRNNFAAVYEEFDFS